MMIPSKAKIAYIRSLFPVGSRIILEYMDDPQSPPPGTMGTVRGVDYLGDVMVAWDNGSSLKVIFGVDRVSML